MHVDVLIIGQGICGSFLSWNLHKEGKSFLVIDDGAENTSSKVAAGIINPVTGRRYVNAWMIEELLEFSKTAYTTFGTHLQKNFLSQKTIIDFFPSPQMRNAFLDRMSENNTYLHTYPNQNFFNNDFNYDFGCGEICPVFIVNLQSLLSSWRKELLQQNSLLHEKFDLNELTVEAEFISYRNFFAQKIIFCDGTASMDNPWFSLLPFSANKGEALIIECAELTNEHIFKKGMLLAPLPEKNTFWLGSNYQWEFENTEPSEKFYKQSIELLNAWLKKPYKVLDHKTAIRPATLERRPFVGFHPLHSCIGILNGMGTKGTSLAPFFAHQLAQNIIHNFPILPEADVKRFSRILSKQ